MENKSRGHRTDMIFFHETLHYSRLCHYVHLLNHHSYYNQEVLTEFGEDTKVAQQWPKSFQCHYLSKHLIIAAKGDRKNKRRNTSFSCATNPQFLNLTTFETKQFCETSSILELDTIQNEASLCDFLNFWTWQHQKRSGSARLPSNMESWVQSWRPRTNAFGDFSTPPV